MNERIEMARAIRAAVQRVARDSVAEAGAAQLLATAPLLTPWAAGKHALGAVVVLDGQVWRCCQAHDSTGNEDWRPGAAPALWSAYHAPSRALARPWVAPSGAHDAYQAGEWMVWTDGAAYRCLADGTVHDPGVTPSAWAAE